MTDHPLEIWHRLVRERDPSGLNALLAEDAVFYSPVVHTPQRGRELAAGYLSAAFHVFFNPTFRYVREIVSATDAMLELDRDRRNTGKRRRSHQVERRRSDCRIQGDDQATQGDQPDPPAYGSHASVQFVAR